MSQNGNKEAVRYVVVGLGDIAQEAVLPGLANAENSKLVGLVSGSSDKLLQLGKRYNIRHLAKYEGFEDCLSLSDANAVYLAVPNHLHRELTERAAKVGCHVLCEKPMAVTPEDCESMIRTCMQNGVRLMLGYRLHFEAANLTAIDLVQKGEIGDPRLFVSIHAQPIRSGDIRTYPLSQGGGPTYDMGVYGINAARYLFRSEPLAVQAMPIWSTRSPYERIEETLSAILKFPGDRMASLSWSFGTAKADSFFLSGTKGSIEMKNAYTYFGVKTLTLTTGQGSRAQDFGPRDQFAAEIEYFSHCILTQQEPEPSGVEGLADVRILQAILQSAQTGTLVELEPIHKGRRPSLAQEIHKKSPTKPGEPIGAVPPARKSEAA